jgi:hypothetical protein
MGRMTILWIIILFSITNTIIANEDDSDLIKNLDFVLMIEVLEEDDFEIYEAFSEGENNTSRQDHQESDEDLK